MIAKEIEIEGTVIPFSSPPACDIHRITINRFNNAGVSLERQEGTVERFSDGEVKVQLYFDDQTDVTALTMAELSDLAIAVINS